MATSEKNKDWTKFSNEVAAHIETYVVPQYGDKHEDECREYSSADCIQQIKKYAARHGKNSRPGQDRLDLIKIAHYAQMAAEKLDDNATWLSETGEVPKSVFDKLLDQRRS